MRTRHRHATTIRAAALGFSLLELLLVLVIISILGGVTALTLRNRAAEARVTTTEQQLRICKQAIESYFIETGSYPTQQDWEQGVLWPKYLEEAPRDAWDQPIYYFYPLDTDPPYDLVSFGPDKEANTEDDLSVLTLNLESN